MRRSKIKSLTAYAPLRKAALTASAASRRPFPAWIVADESGVAFPARAVVPRVRDGLVLRRVAKKSPAGKAAKAKGPTDAHAAR
jgi:hypothetical protein